MEAIGFAQQSSCYFERRWLLMVDEQMMRPIHKEMFVVVNTPEEVLSAIFDGPSWDPSTRRLAAI